MARSVIILLAAGCLLSSCYLTKQGYRQLSLLAAREPVSEVVQSKSVTPSVKHKLEFSSSAIAFARTQELETGSAYQDYVHLNGDAVSYTVQAAMPTEMKLKTWWFPVVGSVPYLGFFDKEDRDAEARALNSAGFETHLGGVTAYSSLGWFADPIFSSMLRRSDAELAHLYFHELTHRTLWLSDGVEFNENLAEFIADKMTVMFFNSIHRQQELGEFDAANGDYLLFRAWLMKLRSDLEQNLLKTKDMPEINRVSEKNKVISLAISAKPTFKQVDFVGSGNWNNARILAAGLYAPDITRFEAAAKCFQGGEVEFKIGKFLKTLKNTAEMSGTGFKALEHMCEKK